MSLVCIGNNQFGVTDIPYEAINLVSKVGCGVKHVCVKKVNGQIVCWGSDQHGNTTVPTELRVLNANTMTLSVGAEHTCAINNSGMVVCWGLNLYKQCNGVEKY
mmetsp:Transcript_38513/g.32527  ORF Transcript_38513/g.32527 Transcript_38513/m.32527 type:complete len:104 (+) Transcript_38513:436-747(+)